MSLAEDLKEGIAAAELELRAHFGDRLSTAEAVRRHHGTGEAYHPVSPPDAVVFAQSTGEVAEVVRIAARHRVPLVPYGAGTSLEGNTLAVRGGISFHSNLLKPLWFHIPIFFKFQLILADFSTDRNVFHTQIHTQNIAKKNNGSENLTSVPYRFLRWQLIRVI